MTQIYPKPDRSNFQPNFVKTEQNDAIDIGWAVGTFSDGREYRAECWAIDQVTMLTIFFSTKSLEATSHSELNQLLVEEGLIKFLTDMDVVTTREFTDPAGNPCWSMNIHVGIDDEVLIEDTLWLKPYTGSE